jgi:hypothetical protein
MFFWVAVDVVCNQIVTNIYVVINYFRTEKLWNCLQQLRALILKIFYRRKFISRYPFTWYLFCMYATFEPGLPYFAVVYINLELQVVMWYNHHTHYL